MDNALDDRPGALLTSALRTQRERARGATSHRGHGETRAGTDGTAPDRRTPPRWANDRRRERLPDGLVHDHRRVPWTAREVRSRRAFRTSRRSPRPTRVSSTPGSGPWASTLPADAREAIDAHVRLLLAWTVAINLTAIRDPAEVARLHVLDSLAAVPHLAATRRRRGCSTSARAAAFPGLPLAAALGADRALLVDSVGKKVRFLRTVSRRPASSAGSPRRRSGPRRSRATRGTARRWPAVTARAVTSLAELVELGLPLLAPGGVLVAWKRGPRRRRAGRRGRGAPGAAGRPGRGRAGGVPGLEGHCLVIVPRGGAHRRPLPARPGGAAAPAALSRRRPRATLAPDARRRALRHPREPRRRSTRCSPRSRPWTRSGSSATSWGTGPHPDEVVARLRELGAIGVRGNHDAAATGGLEIELVQRRRAAGDGVDPDDDRGRHPRLARRAARDARAGGLPAGPRQPARPDLGVRHLHAGGTGRHGGDGPRRSASTAIPTSRSPTSRTTGGSRR